MTWMGLRSTHSHCAAVMMNTTDHQACISQYERVTLAAFILPGAETRVASSCLVVAVLKTTGHCSTAELLSTRFFRLDYARFQSSDHARTVILTGLPRQSATHQKLLSVFPQHWLVHQNLNPTSRPMQMAHRTKVNGTLLECITKRTLGAKTVRTVQQADRSVTSTEKCNCG